MTMEKTTPIAETLLTNVRLQLERLNTLRSDIDAIIADLEV